MSARPDHSRFDRIDHRSLHRLPLHGGWRGAHRPLGVSRLATALVVILTIGALGYTLGRQFESVLLGGIGACMVVLLAVAGYISIRGADGRRR